MPKNNSDETHEKGESQFLPALLKALCPDDPDEACMRCLRLHAKLTGFLRSKGMYDPENDAHETLERADKKIAAGKNIPDVEKFCFGIAKNIVHEREKQEKRQKSAFAKFWEYIQDKITDSRVDLMDLMKRCFEKLSEEDQTLLISYYNIPKGEDRTEYRLRLAKRHNWSIGALRIHISRLRLRLKKCVEALRKKG